MSVIKTITEVSVKKRIEYIDALRGFSMFCVVLMHFWNRFPMEIQHNVYFGMIETVIQMFFLPLFFLISGFFSYKRLSKTNIIDKFITYIFAAFLFSLLYGVFICGRNYDFGQMTSYRYYWFTIALFQMLLLTQVILLLNKYKSLCLLLVSVLLLLFVPIIDRMEEKPFMCDILAWREVCFFYSFYVLGVICGTYKSHFEQLLDKKWFRNIIVISFIVLLGLRGYTSGILDFGLAFICRFSATMTIFLLFHYFRDFFSSGNLVSRTINLVGKRTLDIYFLHYFFLPSTVCMTFLMQGNNIMTMMIMIGTIITLVVMAISILCGQLIRLSPTLSRWLLGNK